MSIPGIASTDSPKIIYLVERLPPQKASPSERSFLDKIKYVTGYILATVGLILLIGAATALSGHVFGFFTLGVPSVEMLFTTSLMAMIAGFNLASKNSPSSAEVYLGSISVTV